MSLTHPPSTQSQIFQVDITFQRESGEKCNLDFHFAMGKHQMNTWVGNLLLQQFGLPIQKWTL